MPNSVKYDAEGELHTQKKFQYLVIIVPISATIREIETVFLYESMAFITISAYRHQIFWNEDGRATAGLSCKLFFYSWTRLEIQVF